MGEKGDEVLTRATCDVFQKKLQLPFSVILLTTTFHLECHSFHHTMNTPYNQQTHLVNFICTCNYVPQMVNRFTDQLLITHTAVQMRQPV